MLGVSIRAQERKQIIIPGNYFLVCLLFQIYYNSFIPNDHFMLLDIVSLKT